MFFRLIPVNAIRPAGFAFLIGVLVIGANWGLTESITGSLFAVLCFKYYFLPPILNFTIADPQNWVALFAFLVTSITASRLASQARRRAREAQERQEEMERLYAFSRSILLTDPARSISKQLAALVAQTFGARAVAAVRSFRREKFIAAAARRISRASTSSCALPRHDPDVHARNLPPASITAIRLGRGDRSAVWE